VNTKNEYRRRGLRKASDKHAAINELSDEERLYEVEKLLAKGLERLMRTKQAETEDTINYNNGEER
jgi:hypothetical protein